jgi:hypothetical protein
MAYRISMDNILFLQSTVLSYSHTRFTLCMREG